MLETYKAKIQGDKIEWETDAPRSLQDGAAVEVLVTVFEAEPETEGLRPFGLAKGDFVVPEDFDAPLPEEILASFER